jgi:spore maturation protein CgeB
MKIFIPLRHHEDSFAHNVLVTLQALGHDARSMGKMAIGDYWSLPGAAVRFLRERLRGESPSREERAVVAAAREFRPDAVLSTTASLHPAVLEELGKICGKRRILWWGDTAANSRRWGIMDPGWDCIYLKERRAVEKLRLAGRNAFHLHEAMNPAWHRPVAGGSDGCVAVAGNYYAFRQAVLLRLMGDGVPMRLYGSPPPRWAHPEIRKRHTGRYVVGEEKSRAFGEASACLNTFDLSEGDSLNCRAFEIAGAAGLQLIEDRPAVGECFERGKEILPFRTYEELFDRIERARKYPGEMDGIRKAGAKRALAEHTYRHRLEVILGNL